MDMKNINLKKIAGSRAATASRRNLGWLIACMRKRTDACNLRAFTAFCALSAILLPVLPAYAGNPAIDNALRSRPDLSAFYKALVDTGVAAELEPDMAYTVFAPDNAAFAEMPVKYNASCLNSVPCKAVMADIIRNHILPGTIHISDAVQHEGGLFSIGQRFVRIGEPVKGTYTMDGQEILGLSTFDGDRLYTIDGVIASRHELALLSLSGNSPALRVIGTTVRQRTIPDPACGAAGCPGTYTRTTIIENPGTAIMPAGSE